jgi:hypothetical protein
MTLAGCRIKQIGMFLGAPFVGAAVMCAVVVALLGAWIGILFMEPVQVNKGRWMLKWRK